MRVLLAALLAALLLAAACSAQRPNVLIAISDDQSYPHASAYGCKGIETPAFDRIAEAGVLFTNAFTPAPGCSPMRAAFLTGRYIWQIEHAGTHASSFPKKYESFQDRLEAAGYHVGYTGKGWGPGNWKVSGRTRNPAGPAWQKRKMKAPKGIRKTDYAANFSDFLDARKKGQPFSFWFGASEPHRVFDKGIGRKNGKKLADAAVPKFLPDTETVRSDILDYYFEIEWSDRHLGRMLDELHKRGELDNTIVIVTSDNGMAFPRAKANVYEFGIHMPLAVAWPAKWKGGRTTGSLVNLIDVTATIYEATGVAPPTDHPIAGRSFVELMRHRPFRRPAENLYAEAPFVLSGRERHSSSRYRSLGYPQRCIRTKDLLLIWNMRPERWPAGTPRKLGKNGKPGPMHGGYHDIDACPTLTEMKRDEQLARFLALATQRRGEYELYDVDKDPACLHDLADDPEFAARRKELQTRLHAVLRATGDPRIVGEAKGDVFETYPRYSGLRRFPIPDWAKNEPASVPRQDWLDRRTRR